MVRRLFVSLKRTNDGMEGLYGMESASDFVKWGERFGITGLWI